MEAYGQCSYVRLQLVIGRVHVAFLMGKARVGSFAYHKYTPLGIYSSGGFCQSSLDVRQGIQVQDVKHVFWSDS